MRARKKKHREERVTACSEWLITEPAQMNEYEDRFPITLEIGCGKGTFICTLAKNNPDKMYFAIELVTDVLITALERAKNENIKNVRFLNINAQRINEFFVPESIAKIHLNFSDPWPRDKQAKRRLTYHSFLELYKRSLTTNGIIEVKTDNDKLYDFTLIELSGYGFVITEQTRDLHSSKYNDGNIMTEYEANFSSKGVPIKYVKAMMRS